MEIDLTDKTAGMSDDEKRTYWFRQSPDARLAELMRLNYLAYGDAIFQPMDKTKIKVIKLSDKK